MKMKKLLLTIAATFGMTALTMAQNVPSYVPTNGLVGWWPFNGNANDESGNGNNGAVNGAILTNDRFGISSASYSFNGNVAVDFPSQNLNQNFTVSLWFNPDTLYVLPCGAHEVFGNFTNNQAFPNGHRIGINELGQISVGNGIAGTPNPNYYQANNWINAIYTYEFVTQTMSLYINNQLESSISGLAIVNYGNFFRAGARANAGPYCGFVGKIDDIGIWNRALTPSEITALYTGVPTDSQNDGSSVTNTVPAAISYQAVARDAQGQPLSEADMQVKFTVLADSLTGAAEYSESHALTTNALGLFNTAFGAGTPLSGTFATINWAAGNKYLKVELDAGSGFVDMGTQQLLSVPYSMRSNTSAKAGTIENAGLPVYADNAAALAGGLVAGQLYRTPGGVLMIVY